LRRRRCRASVEELDEFDDLAVAKPEDVCLGRLGHFAGDSTLERNPAQNHNSVVLGDEIFGIEINHFPRRTKLCEILLGSGLAFPALGEVQPRVLITQGANDDIIREQFEPGLNALAARVILKLIGVP
jgi:hypothetical protein